MRIIGTAVVAIVAIHAAHTFHSHFQTLRGRHAAMAVAHPVMACSAPANVAAIGVLWPETAIVPISPAVGNWHATVSALAY